VRRLALVSAAALLAGCGVPAVPSTRGEISAPSEATAAVIAHYQSEIPRLMEEQEYQTASRGLLDLDTPPSRLYEQNGQLYFDGSDSDDGTYRLHEVERGLFFTETGEALDLRTEHPTFRNLQLTRVGPGPAPVAWALLVACGLVMLAAVTLVPLRRRVLRGHRAADSAAPRSGGRAIAPGTGSLAIAVSLSGLAAIALVALLPRVIYMGYVGWLDLPTWQEIWLRAPLALTLFTVAFAAVTAATWRRARHTNALPWAAGALIAAALIEITLLASWHLIGVS